MEIKPNNDRAHIDFADRFKQPILFEGLTIGKMYPTDIDAMTEYHNRLFIFMEVKYENTALGYGQQTALERLADAIQSTGKDALVLVCRHTVEDRTKPVMLRDTLVTSAYFKGAWYVSLEGVLTDKVWRDAMQWAMDKEEGIPTRDLPWGE